MEKSEFMTVLRSVNMASDAELEAMLDKPVRDTDFDSLDFEILRTALEKKIGRDVPENVWQDARTLRALMEAV